MDRYILVILDGTMRAVVDTQPAVGNPIVVATSETAAAMIAYRDVLNGE